MMRLLLLEDEQLAADRIQALLKDYFGPDLALQWGQSIQEGLAFLANNPPPDLIISDIELLDGSAFSIYQQIEVTAPIIFVTAYDQYLLDAFNTNGIGYVLKPYTDEALRVVLDKYQKLLQRSEQVPTVSAAVIEQLKAAMHKGRQDYKERFTVKKSSGIYFLKTADIKFFQADGDLVFAFDHEGKKHLINFRMSELEEKLDPRVFFRINRGQMVNIEYIVKLESYFGNRLSISIQGGSEALITSGPKTAAFRKWVED
ncbi:MAG: LytTR family DNA-binding domain-containing protein [Bacteroidota bacterium]